MTKKILFLILLVSAVPMCGQQLATRGTDFWVAFMSNYHDNDIDTYYLYFSAQRSCKVYVTNPVTGWTDSVQVGTGRMYKLYVPRAQCWQAGSNIVTDKGLHITATDSVDAYAFNNNVGSGSVGMATLLTTSSLGSHYYVDTYPSVSNDPDAHAQFSILAISDSTEVTIRYPASVNYPGIVGTQTTGMLRAGEVFQVQAPSGQSDLSGTELIAAGCKPFAVFMGNSAAFRALQGTGGDHLYVQARPTNVWGREWIVHNQRQSGCVRVTARDDNTIITNYGTQIAVINRGETYQINFNNFDLYHLKTSWPCQVHQYVYSGGYSVGSVFATNPLSLKHHRSVSTFFPQLGETSGGSGGINDDYHFAVIIAPTDEIREMSFAWPGHEVFERDTSFLFGPTTPVGNSGYSYRVFWTQDNAYESKRVFGTTGSGLGGYFEAYDGSSYELFATEFGGVGIADTIIDTVVCADTFYYNGISYTQPGRYRYVGECSDVTVLQLTFAHNDTIPLDTTLCGNFCDWHGRNLTSSGYYYRTIARNAQHCDSLEQLHLVLNPIYDTVVAVHSCDTVWTNGDTTIVIPESGVMIPRQYSSIYGCDSLVRYSFLYHPAQEVWADEATCDSVYYLGDSAICTSGDYVRTIPSAFGCDSTVHLHLIIYPGFDSTYYDTIRQGETYTWINNITYDDAAYAEVRYLTQDGCDSIYRLKLRLNPEFIDSLNPYIWAPNIFTPSRSGNNEFRVISNNVDFMNVMIFNRMGEQVYAFDGLTQSWDGTHNGRPCPQGTYVYLIKYTCPGLEKPKPLYGTITLIR